MNTLFLLMAEYNSAVVQLDHVATKYLGIRPEKARMKAARSELPFPAFRVGTQKSPWLVNIIDLAEWLDKEREEATKEWQIRQSP